MFFSFFLCCVRANCTKKKKKFIFGVFYFGFLFSEQYFLWLNKINMYSGYENLWSSSIHLLYCWQKQWKQCCSSVLHLSFIWLEHWFAQGSKWAILSFFHLMMEGNDVPTTIQSHMGWHHWPSAEGRLPLFQPAWRLKTPKLLYLSHQIYPFF